MLKLMGSPDTSRPHCTAGQRVARKYRKAYQRRLRRKEYTKLRNMVPAVATQDKVSKVTVIEEAIKYIEELHQALAQRLKSSGVPEVELDTRRMSELVRHLVPYHVMMAGVLCENRKKVATWRKVETPFHTAS